MNFQYIIGRKLPLNPASRKKQRGQWRKLQRLLARVESFYLETDYEPWESFDHYHVPAGDFINSPKTAGHIKTAFCRAWLAKTQEFIEKKPKDAEYFQVIAILDWPAMWGSEIIIFYTQEECDRFFRIHPGWRPVSGQPSFVQSRGIPIPGTEQAWHSDWIDIDEDSDATQHSGYDIWFYGELPPLPPETPDYPYVTETGEIGGGSGVYEWPPQPPKGPKTVYPSWRKPRSKKWR